MIVCTGNLGCKKADEMGGECIFMQILFSFYLTKNILLISANAIKLNVAECLAMHLPNCDFKMRLIKQTVLVFSFVARSSFPGIQLHILPTICDIPINLFSISDMSVLEV